MNSRTRRYLPDLARIAALLLLTSAAQGADPTASIETAVVRRLPMDIRLESYGTLQPDPDALTSINLPRAGLVNRLLVRLGQRVKAGDTLLEIDTAPATRMDYLQASGAVDYARSDVERVKRLLGEQLATRDQLQTAQRNLADAAARLHSLQQIGADLQLQAVRSPFDGIVTQLSVTQGMRVQADTTALLLGHQDRLIALLGVEPEDARLLSAGQALTVTPVFDPEVRIVSQIGAVHALINPATRMVDVVVPVPADQAAGLMLGSSIQASITIATQERLVVPRAAVQSGSDGDWVFTVEDGRARRVPVTVELAQGAHIAIAGALRAGQRVITTGSHVVEDGMAVREAGQ